MGRRLAASAASAAKIEIISTTVGGGRLAHKRIVRASELTGGRDSEGGRLKKKSLCASHTHTHLPRDSRSPKQASKKAAAAPTGETSAAAALAAAAAAAASRQ